MHKTVGGIIPADNIDGSGYAANPAGGIAVGGQQLQALEAR